jgi:thioredoxin reductase (NADPH)
LNQKNSIVDCAVIGGGPAGLAAALYLARYHLPVIVFDDATSRAATIPFSHNVPGFPEGITGKDLLSRMRHHALRYGAEIAEVPVTTISRLSRGFRIEAADRQVQARTVLVATGVRDRRPQMPEDLHDAAVRDGLLRYCPICDGFEVTDRKIVVIGTGSHAYSEAVFLRSFTQDLSLVSQEAEPRLSNIQLADLEKLGIQLILGPVVSVAPFNDTLRLTTAAGVFSYDAAYPAFGCTPRSSLAQMVGAELSTDGCIKVDRHQRSTVPGLYAAGDNVAGLNQISNAVGQAAIAATAIRNDLSQSEMICR